MDSKTEAEILYYMIDVTTVRKKNMSYSITLYTGRIKKAIEQFFDYLETVALG